ncbi:MAG: glycosyltransferase family 4 protein [Pirellulaceae bacterium]|jgi:glycosyltransferase involved in cell wall biosynthesis|nr:glycosyltransferase family 4 protein [Pirellulaceae bacterium]MDP7015314.1 glycosyltransferase family 4 protein [Pirellulaceae bacterium]
MSGLRIAMVTRRYWPLVGGAEMVMSNLTSEFLALGHRPQVVTAQWESDWPTEVVHREAPVVRLPNPKQRGWGTLRYMTALARYFRQRRDQFDCVLVSMLKHDAYVVLGALEEHLPVVLRAEGAGETGDCHWHEVGRFGRRIRKRCQAAHAFIAPSEAIRAEMAAAGFDDERLHFVANGVALGGPRDEPVRLAARAALGEANHDLVVFEDSPVIVYTGRLHANKGLFELIKAFRPIAEQFPNARLWLIGEGPEREQLFDSVVDMGLHHQVFLPGVFDDIGELLLAADMFVLPSYQEGMSISLLEAMGARLPVVASDIPGNRTLVENDRHGLLVPVKNVAALSAAMMALLQDPPRADRLAAAAQQRVRDEFSLLAMAERHLELMTDTPR